MTISDNKNFFIEIRAALRFQPGMTGGTPRKV